MVIDLDLMTVFKIQDYPRIKYIVYYNLIEVKIVQVIL